MSPESADNRPGSRAPSSARTKLLVSFGAAVALGAVAAVAGAGRAAPLIGWDILALVYGGWVWAFGMTFQVSDTDLQSKAIRRTALRHAWLSFPLVAVIIATSINLVSGLAK